MQGNQLAGGSLRFTVKVALFLLVWWVYHEQVGGFMGRVSTVSLGGLTVTAPVVRKVQRGNVEVASRFTVLETRVNSDKIEVVGMQFSSDDDESEFIEVRAKRKIDLRFGLLADAKRLYGQSTSGISKKDKKRGDVANHKHKDSELLTFDFYDEDSVLEEGESLRIYTYTPHWAEVAQSGNHEVMAVRVKPPNGLLTRGELQQQEKDEIFKYNEKGIWKSDYYEADRVFLADGTGEVLLDFIYTLVPS